MKVKSKPGHLLAPLNTNCIFSKALRYGNTQFYLQTSHPVFTPQPQSISTIWLVLNYSCYHSTEGIRLSRPGWLVTYRNKVSSLGVEPGLGH